MESHERPSFNVYGGLFLLALSLLMHEILLTRLFSVSLFYHFAFMAVSIAMFGMTIGALAVILYPKLFPSDKFQTRLGLCSLGVAAAQTVFVMAQVFMPMANGTGQVVSVNFILAQFPFLFGGICLSLILARYRESAGRLYAVDLAGSALGCLAVILVFAFADGPTAVLVAAALASVASWSFLRGSKSRRLRMTSLAALAVLAAAVAINATFVARHESLLRLRYVKGKYEERPLYEKWNHFSRVQVENQPQLPVCARPPSYRLEIDANAETDLTQFDGDVATLGYLKHDLQNAALFLRPQADVMVVGAGGGRDILSALAYGAKSVRAVEINQDISGTANGPYGDFTGHLDRRPEVTYVTDEARSYLARTPDKFDVLQISLIDTWAASAAGAYSLTENGLYTVEAWRLFLGRLKPHGVLTVTRWYTRGMPSEIYRITSLAAEALRERGVADPRGHIMIVKNNIGGRVFSADNENLGTILVSNDPFSQQDVASLEKFASSSGYTLALTPEKSVDPTLAFLANGQADGNWFRAFPIDITPPTDNRPYFFNMLRFEDAFRTDMGKFGYNGHNMEAVAVLLQLLALVSILSVICILAPAWLTLGDHAWRKAFWPSVYFVGIGLGFMLVEISQMQRWSVFLGHPTYSLAVTLFSLLVGSGIGSFWADRTLAAHPRRAILAHWTVLGLALVFYGLFAPFVSSVFSSSATWLRSSVVVLSMLPLGVCMGAAFPLGLARVARHTSSLVPWYWAVNGATSVCASVLAVVISMRWGMSAAFWLGVVGYALAAVGMLMERDRGGS